MFCVFLIEYYKVDPVVYRNKDDEVMNGVTESGVGLEALSCSGTW